ncbi:MAG: flippase-like domain-containing protein [Deltaproteobacteria bacterium]|nr:flippase-like domain-containing protein [Deltaproteobacteria bacterium]
MPSPSASDWTDDVAAPTRRARIKAIVRWAVAGLIFVFLIGVLIAGWEQIREQNLTLHWGPLTLATLLNAVFFVPQAVVWRDVVTRLGYPIPALTGVHAWAASQVSKYVPGKVMLFVVRAALAGREGVPKAATILGVFVELLLNMAGAAVVFLIWGGALLTKLAELQVPTWLPPVLAACVFIGMHPRIMNFGINLGLRLLKREPVLIDLPFHRTLALGALLSGAWVVHGVSAYFCFAAIGITPEQGVGVYAAIFALGWLIGLLGFVTPGGIGVREGAIAAMLSVYYSLEIGVAVALVSRLVWVLAEISLTALVWPWRARVQAFGAQDTLTSEANA